MKIFLHKSKIINKIRLFFHEKNILEVDTPSLSRNTVTDSNLFPFKTFFKLENDTDKKLPLWLVTSPEYHMKRLLSKGIGPIYQICHSFRNSEYGKNHNHEFLMLEWYLPFYDMFELMYEVNIFLQEILNCRKAEIISYKKIFIKYLNINPFDPDLKRIIKVSKKLGIHSSILKEKDFKSIFDSLFFLGIEPYIGKSNPIMVYHFPYWHSSLAKLNFNDFRLSDRFEVYFKGLELGNGFCELIDYYEQKERFKQDIIDRKKKKLSTVKIDYRFLNVLKNKLPPCSGIAIGLDRLIMIILGLKNIRDVIYFNFNNC
ncbi:elongation factor P--(R)-beta-lysine ligase [Buchnera aphidicola (Kurisakia onigurumii)]|uniref:elongation factor P--(R)-beta-lysine ligase n=1 Tax=Buchnera aphidicola TaxID=9 RepID=UPI0031B70CB8